jgi:hypothetical protein
MRVHSPFSFRGENVMGQDRHASRIGRRTFVTAATGTAAGRSLTLGPLHLVRAGALSIGALDGARDSRRPRIRLCGRACSNQKPAAPKGTIPVTGYVFPEFEAGFCRLTPLLLDLDVNLDFDFDADIGRKDLFCREPFRDGYQVDSAVCYVPVVFPLQSRRT